MSLSSELPTDLKKKLSTFLEVKDTVSLASTNKAFHDDVSFSILDVELVSAIQKHGDHYTGDEPVPICELPIHRKFGDVHSAELTCEWKDQGWGNLKGRLYILAAPYEDETQLAMTDDDEAQETSAVAMADDDDDYSDGKYASRAHQFRNVWTSEVASHSTTSLKATIRISSNERYFVWCEAGGGGGHSLHLDHLKFRTYHIDGADRPLQQTFQFLKEGGAVGSTNVLFPQSVKTIASSLLTQLEQKQKPDPILVNFIESSGLKVEERMLSMLVKLSDGLIEQVPIFRLIEQDMLADNATRMRAPALWNGNEDYDSFDDEDFINGD